MRTIMIGLVLAATMGGCATLVEDGERIPDPTGKMGPQKYKFEDVPAGDWNK